MKIISWNVAGLRARLKKGEIKTITDTTTTFDIICLQETKCASFNSRMIKKPLIFCCNQSINKMRR